MKRCTNNPLLILLLSGANSLKTTTGSRRYSIVFSLAAVTRWNKGLPAFLEIPGSCKDCDVHLNTSAWSLLRPYISQCSRKDIAYLQHLMHHSWSIQRKGSRHVDNTRVLCALCAWGLLLHISPGSKGLLLSLTNLLFMEAGFVWAMNGPICHAPSKQWHTELPLIKDTAQAHSIWGCLPFEVVQLTVCLQLLQFQKQHVKSNFDRDNGKIEVEYFKGGRTNMAYNCIDRHVKEGRGDQPCFLWEGNELDQSCCMTYKQVLDEVSRLVSRHVATTHASLFALASAVTEAL